MHHSASFVPSQLHHNQLEEVFDKQQPVEIYQDHGTTHRSITQVPESMHHLKTSASDCVLQIREQQFRTDNCPIVFGGHAATTAANWCASPRPSGVNNPVLSSAPHMLRVTCLACGNATRSFVSCATLLCRRPFCSQCTAGAEQRGVALINPVTHVCAICDYQSVKRPNCTVTQWHWTFTDHDDLEFTRMLRDCLPPVPGLFLEIHALRQACWRRRVGGIRKHYSFKQHGGFFEGRLQALHVATRNGFLETKQSPFPPITFSPPAFPYSAYFSDGNGLLKAQTPMAFEALEPSSPAPIGENKMLASTDPSHLATSSPLGTGLLQATSPTSSPFSEAAASTPYHVLRPKRVLNNKISSLLKRKHDGENDDDDDGDDDDGDDDDDLHWDVDNLHNANGTSSLMLPYLRSVAPSNFLQQPSPGGQEIDQTLPEPSAISSCSVMPQQLQPTSQSLFLKLCALWNITPGTPKAVTLRAAQEAVTSFVRDAEEEPRCAICCAFVSQCRRQRTAPSDSPTEALTCSIEDCNRVFCVGCVEEGLLQNVTHFYVEAGRCAICYCQSIADANGVPVQLTRSSVFSEHTDRDSLHRQQDLLPNYLKSLPAIPYVWLDESLLEWRVEHHVFFAAAHGGILEARWEAIQFAVAECLRQL